MIYVTCMSHRMQKHKFSVTFPGVLFMETAPGLPKHKKYRVYISLPGCTKMHYVTCRSHRMQKHKFYVTCLGAFFMETAPGPPEHEK
jgi:hypothetical protein